MNYRKVKTMLLIALVLVMLVQPSIAAAGGSKGQVCNYSSYNIWLTAIDKNGRVISLRLEPGACTKGFNLDVEGVWGMACGKWSCWYELWQVGGNSIEVYDLSTKNKEVYISINGTNNGGGWIGDPRGSAWPIPTSQASDIGYSLKNKIALDNSAFVSLNGQDRITITNLVKYAYNSGKCLGGVKVLAATGGRFLPPGTSEACAGSVNELNKVLSKYMNPDPIY